MLLATMQRIAGLELVEDAILHKTTRLNFLHFIKTHGLTAKLMNTKNIVLEAKDLLQRRRPT